MSSRERMLASIRASLQQTRAGLQAEAARAQHEPPPFVHTAQEDLVAQFAAELAKLECFPHPCADEEEALEVIQGILAKHAATQVLAWDLEQVGLPALPALLAKQGIQVHDGQLESPQRAAQLQTLEPVHVCITGADAGIAESATVIVRSGAGRPRLASLLPPVYIAVLRRSQIARGLGEALAMLRAQHGDAIFGDASALAMITGPSRTADIELTLTLGVHGPREVHVVLVG